MKRGLVQKIFWPDFPIFWAWPPRPTRRRNRPKNYRRWCRNAHSITSVPKIFKTTFRFATNLLVALYRNLLENCVFWTVLDWIILVAISGNLDWLQIGCKVNIAFLSRCNQEVCGQTKTYLECFKLWNYTCNISTPLTTIFGTIPPPAAGVWRPRPKSRKIDFCKLA